MLAQVFQKFIVWGWMGQKESYDTMLMDPMVIDTMLIMKKGSELFQ